ncbi:MAG: hypothetical protein LIO65_07990, partial [Odoribacter sp.]|nr:hypothetical protein [Odoribacter sp.]
YYGLWNGKLSITTGAVTAYFWAKNMGNKKYTTFYFTGPAGGTAQLGKPFTCGGSMIFNF